MSEPSIDPAAGEWLSEGPEQTQALGRALAETLLGGEIIALDGELGAGKTCLVKGLALGLGIPSAPHGITSPTFVLHHIYEGGRLPLHHLDAYRLDDAEDFERLGVLCALAEGAVLVVEWAERVADALPSPSLALQLAHAGGDRRRITCRPRAR